MVTHVPGLVRPIRTVLYPIADIRKLYFSAIDAYEAFRVISISDFHKNKRAKNDIAWEHF